jgi:hypothetical protein
MNLFYANGTPVINSLKIQSEVPLDPRLNPETIEERDSLVTKHIAYDRMKVYVKETDSEYVYHKDKNEWVILSKFEKEEKDKLENIKNYLVDTEIIYDKDNNLLYREHSYDPNTNITSLRDYSIPEATVLGDGTLYNGLLSKFYVNRLNNVTGYQTDAKITSDTETESLFLTVTKYNPDTDESVTTNLNIPLVTDDNNGLVSPEKKHWMDNADGLSNTGTTSQTWQLQKSDIDTRLDPNGGVIIKNSGGKLEVRNNQDNSYAPVTLGDIIIEGNVTQKGESFITQAETVEVRDNTILLNRGETAAGVSKGFAGIEIDRGTLPKFQILFDESDRRFKAGEEGDLWCLALRDDDADMLNGMFTSWDSSTKRLKTTNIIPSDRKLAFTDNNSYLQLTSHSFSGDALNQTLRYSNSLGGIFISAGNSSLNLDTDKTVFYFHKNITLPSTISSVSDFLFKRSNVIKLSLKDTVAQFTVPVTAITFNRASDGSEVLYHADLENTEFKNYITIAGPNDIKLYLKSTDEDNYNLISSVDQDGNKLSNMGYYGSYWAIENNRIAVYKYDANGYPEIINQDGTSPGYLRACTSGFLPNVSGNLASGGSGYLGTSSWAFANAYIANNHSNKYYFGTNDVFLDASTTRISARTSGAAIGMNVESLLVSNDYSDETKVPDNGTYSKGAIKSYTGFTSDFRISNLTITKTGSDVLHISSFASDPENIPGTDPISSQVINDGVALTYFWQGDYAFQLVGDIDGTGMAYRMYHPSTGTSTSWKFLADTNWVSNKITSVAGNYLPLAGGTMTGSIIMSNNITIQSKDSGGNSKRLIGKGSDNVTYIGDSDGHTFLYSDAADISHIRNGTSYRIWDASNLTSPLLYASGTTATPTTVYNRNLGVNGSQWTFLSATNAATTSIYAPTAAGTSGQVLTSTGGVPTWSNISSVGDSRYVLKSGDTMTGNLTMNGGWLQFSNNNWSDKGGVYKESEGSLKVWRVSTDAENKPSTYGSVLQINSRSGHWNTQLWIDQTNTAGNNGKLRYRSTKNYSSVEWNDWTVLATEDYVNSKAAGYLPLTGGTLTGQLTIKQSVDIKLRLQSTDADNYCIIQAINAQASQLGVFGYAGDKWAIGHNGIYYEIWDKYNLTNPVTYTTNTYNHATLTNKDGQYFTYIKAGTNGLLPHSKATLVSGGSGFLGTSDQSFNVAYINNLHTNKVTFGVNGPYIIGGTSATQFLDANGGVQKVATGGLYVGPSYTSDDLSLVPTNGIYSRGIIYIENGIGFRNSIWTNDLTPNRNYSGYLQVLDAYDASSAGGPTNYGTVLQVNSRNAHWANQLWFSGGAEASKNGLYYRHMPYNETTYGGWNRLLTNKDVNIIQTQSSSNPSTLPANQIFYSEIQNVAETPTTQGLLFSVQGDDEGIQLWASSSKTELYYRTKWTSFGNWIKLATTSDLGNYLPLTGGTLSGNLTINTVGSTTFVINNNDTNGSETFMRVLRKGTASAAIGFRDSLGAYIYNYNSNKYLFIDNDGYARIGTTSGSTRLALITDIPTVSGYLPLSGGTLTGALTMSSRRNNIVVDVVGGAGNTWDEGAGALSIQVPNDSGQTPLILARRSGAAINTTVATERLLSMELLDTGHSFIIGMSGSEALQLDWTSGKAGTGKLFGKQIATTDQIPTIPSISITTSGSGNVVTGISASGHTLTVTKGSASVSVSWNDITGKPSSFTPSAHTHEYIVGKYTGSGGVIAPGSIGTYKLQCNMMYTNAESSGGGYCDWILMNAYSWSDVPYATAIGVVKAATPSAYIMSGPNSTDKSTWVRKKLATTDEIPTRTSDLTNNSGFLTSSSLSGYATQSWVNNKNYAVQASGNNLIVNSNEFNFANTNTTSIYINYRSGVSGNTTNPITEYKFCNGQGSNSGVKITAETFVGALSGNATTATTASKLGSSTVGGTAKPIYLSAGTATACSATVGSSTVPVYMNAGTITQCSTTLGVSITGNAATSTTATKWNGYDIWVGTESQLPSSRSSTTIYIVTDA